MRTSGTNTDNSRLIRRPLLLLLAIAINFVVVTCVHGADHLDLSGDWRFALDHSDVGVGEAWFNQRLPLAIRLPGSLQEQGFGADPTVDTQWTGEIVDRSFFESPRYKPYRSPDNFKVPFWLQPKKVYVGPAWYQRDVTIPANWRGKRTLLQLERCHWQTTVWVDGRQIASQNSLSTPHEYALTDAFVAGSEDRRTHVITIRVDNRIQDINVGPNSHSIADHTQSNWNGIVGGIRLLATDRVWIDNVQVYPDVTTKTARVEVTIGNQTGRGGQGTLTADAQEVNADSSHDPPPLVVPVSFDKRVTSVVTFTYKMGDDVELWDEFRPALYRLTVSFQGKETPVRPARENTDVRDDSRSESSTLGQTALRDDTVVIFGMREVATKGTQFVVNGQPIFLRGTLECCIFPKTGYPPTDIQSWRRIIQVCQAHGLNHMRFHSHCPPAAAFEAADELGFYFQVECGSWANQGASVGDGKPLDKWLYEEAERILRTFGNHPSFLLMAYGNEPAGPGRGGQYLGPWVTHFRRQDPRRLYTAAAGWPMIPENQFHSTPQPRIHQWGMGLADRLNGQPPATTADYRDFVRQHDVPVIAHEIGQWCVYPDFAEISKYTGVLQAKNFEIFRDFLVANHLGGQAHDFLMASGKLQTLCYKEEIESALRTPGFGGFQLLDLHDFPGQGTALVGVLDPFWDSKPYVAPAEFHRFCNSTVPLARLPKRIFVAGETLEASIEIFHFGPRDLPDAVVAWQLLRADGTAADSGTIPSVDLARGQLLPVGVLSAQIPANAAAQKLRLVVGIEGTDYENDWEVWVYPRELSDAPPSEVLIAERFDDQTLASLRRGGKVLLTPAPETVRSDVAIGFTPVFWNTAWTRNQPPHTLGILCDPRHEAFADFPTEYHTNWQWWELISRSAAMVLDEMPPDLRPLVQEIDTWFEARRLGILFEANVEGGKLLVCSADISHDLDRRPVARQLRYSLLRYMASDEFVPKTTVSVEDIRGILRHN